MGRAEVPGTASASATTRLVLIRHGHTLSNSGGTPLLSGRTDVPLSERGGEEVRRLQARLRGGPGFAAIYTSPLERARRTAEALGEVGLGPVRSCAALEEIDCGELDGLPLEEVQRRVPEHWAANLRQDDAGFRWPGGESYRELRARALAAVRAIALAHRGERVALVTHAGVIGQVFGALEGVSPARWSAYRPGNTALSELDWGRGGGRIVSFDDHAHLADPLPPGD
ncbi:MAG TPA: histidine phosphatase family protein [Gemmatimonadales bacterium]|nr:histidine phosphatase family protein [Gemmatimonadales bacterium]